MTDERIYKFALKRGLTEEEAREVADRVADTGFDPTGIKDVWSPYLIWSHEHGAWWGPGGFGYTSNMDEAGRYSREEAIRICRKAIPGTAAELGALPELPVRLADLKEMGI